MRAVTPSTLSSMILSKLARRTGMVPREQYDAAVFVIRDIATSIPQDAGSTEYGQTAAQMVLKCRTFLGLTDDPVAPD